MPDDSAPRTRLAAKPWRLEAAGQSPDIEGRFVTITTESTYENGVLKPVRPLPLGEQEQVELVIRTPPAGGSQATTSVPVAERQQALCRLLSLQLPVADWEEMEQEIIRGVVE